MNLRKVRLILLFYVGFDFFFGGICGGFFQLTPLAAAQFTTVSGTVTDPNGFPYAGGTIVPSLVISASPKFTATNQPYTPPSQPVGLSSTGSFVMQLADVTALTPGGGTYTFTVSCAVGCVPPVSGKGPVTFTITGITISGVSQSITSQLTAAALTLVSTTGAVVGPDPNNTPECTTAIAASGIAGQLNIAPGVKWLNTGVLHGAICVTTTGATVPIGVFFNLVQANSCCHLDIFGAGSGRGVRVLDPVTQSPNNGGVDLIPSVNGLPHLSMIISGQTEGGTPTEQAITASQGADGNALYQFGLNGPGAHTGNLQALTYGTGQTPNTDGAGTLTAAASTVTYTWANTHYTVHPICTVSDETTVTSAVKVTYNTTVSVTFTTPGATDVIDFLCAPRN